MRHVWAYLLRVVSFLLFLSPLPVLAASIQVSWNRNQEADLAGYMVFYGLQEATYGTPLQVGRDATSCRIDNLENGKRYCVQLQAFDTSGYASPFSDAVCVSIPVLDTTPPSGSIIINAGAAFTPTRGVSLTLKATDASGSVAGMKLSNDGKAWSAEVAYSTTQAWTLTQGDGTKTVYAMFRDAAGNWSAPVSDSIEFGLDTDGDGMPDAWEVAHGLDPNNPNDAGLDADNDGITNYEEYLAHTNPCDSTDNAPRTEAGANQQTAPTRVNLDGSASRDSNGDSITWAWSQVLGPIQVVIRNPTSARASFLAVKAGLYRFRLTCSDGKTSASDPVDITVTNVAPRVDAGGDMAIDAGLKTRLHATGVDPNSDTLKYTWSQRSGPSIQMPTTTGQDLELVLKTPGLYRFSVACNDGVNTGAADDVYVTVNSSNHAPTADAGVDRDAPLTQRVILNAFGSTDPDKDTLRYTWVQVSGPMVNLHDSSAARSWFDTVYEGTYGFELGVSDAKVSAVPDRVMVRVLNKNTPPEAEAGNDIKAWIGDLVTLDAGTSYDPDNDPLSFRWIQEAGARVVWSPATGSRIQFTPTVAGVLKFRVVVADGKTQSEDTVVVSVNGGKGLPVAEAGYDLAALPDTEVLLDGSASRNPEGLPLSYIWSQCGGPRVSLKSPNSAKSSFQPLLAGIYVFELRVYDGMKTGKPDTVTVTVQGKLGSLQLVSPARNSTISTNPTFLWSGRNSSRYHLYAALDTGAFLELYAGSGTSYTTNLLWYLLVPSDSCIFWYVTGDAPEQMTGIAWFTMQY